MSQINVFHYLMLASNHSYNESRSHSADKAPFRFYSLWKSLKINTQITNLLALLTVKSLKSSSTQNSIYVIVFLILLNTVLFPLAQLQCRMVKKTESNLFASVGHDAGASDSEGDRRRRTLHKATKILIFCAITQLHRGKSRLEREPPLLDRYIH